ncbi:protein of unknown function [Actinokineospora alba]|uniref:DUF397 domain-containing protein n=1 Tax=Actinokineospora alba TaxID=504798 RepID=A0A1H0VS30_9PSEU|nr:DUF397 domain-containing protein [Actinokineospora alba]TDP70148.1 uncharacterized protein DUF397 [Actinokineospora alba]SDI37924.1 protein of unknown function [Actinokineospora alba]SDP80975.1 protein of unknown function [Actinokineospora alba]
MDLDHARWRKSSRSTGDTETECVEVAFVPGTVGVRDSKKPEAGALVVSERAWRSALVSFR